ncbi:MAG: type II toxin-antitoxin system VapC family toxin [Microbacteriaceae bacterium]
MSFLIDTHVLLWWLVDDPSLTPVHRDLIADGTAEVYVSSITIAEISIKVSIGKLSIPEGLNDAIIATGFQELPFTFRHAAQLRNLPWHHRDPFDRMLVSQAMVDGLVFLTADPRCREYDVVVR